MYHRALLRTILSASFQLATSAAALANPLLELDANEDGLVTIEELEARASERWSRNDIDLDGEVTADEMKAVLAEFRQARFAARDADGSGLLERSELAGMPETTLLRFDIDKNGALSQAELDNGLLALDHDPTRGPLKLLLGDADDDGFLTRAEATAAARTLARGADVDDDEKLSAEELERAPALRSYGPLLLGLDATYASLP
jgi:Ca2+-binding EF-hand superfamily protein